MKMWITGWAALIILTCVQANPLTLQKGDRVVLLGNTFIEREGRYGYLETAITSRYPGADITFRNLGWSGDTVFGDARAYFDSPTQGYQRLIERTKSLKPTVIIFSYGLNESFQGEAGLKKFTEGYGRLLKDLQDTKARFVLMAPLRIEANSYTRDIEAKNQSIDRYTDTIKSVAKTYQAEVLDLNGSLADRSPRTDNGLHLTPFGYRQTVADLERSAGWEPRKWSVSINAKAGTLESVGTKVKPIAKLEYQLQDDFLPLSPLPKDSPQVPAEQRKLSVLGLEPGSYTLTIDDQKIVTADESAWAKGIQITTGPEYDQAEKMRETIVTKNEMYFYSWRPQNITYLLGFRKHEQGNNAKELDMFEPLIVEKESLIQKASIPVPHTYRWSRN